MKKLVLALAVIVSFGMISCDSQNQNAEGKGEVPAENVENVEAAPVENEVVTEENKEAQADEQTAEEQKTDEKTEEAPAEPAK